MKLTESQLRQIICEEIIREMNPRGRVRPDPDEAYGIAYDDARENPDITVEDVAEMNGWNIDDPRIEAAILDAIDNALEAIELGDEGDHYYDDMDGDPESALASAGMGTDEDYGHYGGDDW